MFDTNAEMKRMAYKYIKLSNSIKQVCDSVKHPFQMHRQVFHVPEVSGQTLGEFWHPCGLSGIWTYPSPTHLDRERSSLFKIKKILKTSPKNRKIRKTLEKTLTSLTSLWGSQPERTWLLWAPHTWDPSSKLPRFFPLRMRQNLQCSSSQDSNNCQSTFWWSGPAASYSQLQWTAQVFSKSVDIASTRSRSLGAVAFGSIGGTCGSLRQNLFRVKRKKK